MGTDLKRYNDIPGEEHGPAPTEPHDEFGRPLVIEVEKNIPIPNKRQKSSKYYFDIYSLEVGDSVFCPTENMARAICLKLKRHGFKGTAKKWENGFRVWRTE